MKFYQPLFQGFQSNIPPRKGPVFPRAVALLGKSLNVGLSGEISLLKKVPKPGDFLPGKCHHVVLCNSPCWSDLSANKGDSVLIRIRVGLVCRAAAKPLAHGELMGGVFPKYPQMAIYRAESALPSPSTFWEFRTPCWGAESWEGAGLTSIGEIIP